MTKLFRLRIKDGYVSPATKMTNVHSVDMSQMLIPARVAAAIWNKEVDWRDVVRCVASGKDPTILITVPDAVKPRKELEDAPDFKQEAVVPAPEPEKSTLGELALARAENRAPDVAKLTNDELVEQAKLVGVDPAGYSTQSGLVRAVLKKMGG